MLKRSLRKLMLSVAALALAIFGLSAVASAQYQAGAPTTTQNVQPVMYAGNFVADDDDQVCYALCDLLDCDVTNEMRGIKIDPPVNFANDDIDITISADGRYLDWTALNGAEVLYFIIKGGPNFNLYDYISNGNGFTSDTGLHSPGTLNKRGQLVYPAISHYNACYIPGDDDDGDQGCTPGYWRNHADRWLGASPTDNFDSTFGVTLFGPNVTLGMVINNPQTYGTFGFHAVAALLNSYGGVPNADGTTVDYAYSTAQVMSMVQSAVANDTQGATKNLFAAANEAGCPLSGTRANPVP